jgi:hypothetical protein
MAGYKADKTRTGRERRIGVIDRNRIYNAAALRKLGIGRLKLTNARAAGVRPAMIGVDYWYDGGELIDWILSHRSEQN